MTAESYDAVVVGAGPNGLVAANHLLDAGWSVLVLEAQPSPGGAVRSDRDVHPDYVHDTFSAFYPLTAASPLVQAFHLEEHGLRWRHAPAVVGHPRPDGTWATLHRDRSVTAALLDEHHAGDGDAWLRTCEQWDRIGDAVVRALLTPFPPVRAGVSALTRLRSAGGLDLVRDLLTPARRLAEQRFGGEHARLLIAGNAGHADIPLNAPGSGLMGWLLCMLGQTVGYPVPEGGAGRLAEALVRRAESLGGEVRCNAEVVRVDVDDGRAAGVRTADGRAYRARKAVLADVAAPHLYGGLLPDEQLPARVRRGMRRFELDPSTIKVDWALDGPVPWASPPPHAPGTVHVADSVDDMTEALGQVSANAVPARPFLLAGQMTTADPTRSPTGTESMWAYTHVPQHTTRDAGDGGVRGVWDHDDLERFADRVQHRVESLAPGFGDRVVARRVLGPRELEARDANLIGGAINGGTSQLHQQLVFRPVPGLGRAETPVPGLYLASASAHPGGGVHGACGSNAARAAVAHDRVRGLLRRR
ncbi:phytoene desaturase family protein [Nocardioides iriomotensis]|uniref:Pyridine nucleotide-disulfide oxidoreductase domain-containing protein 2 n=1 Tax=Nocardioides iriomotensis TaxID=715784 RepID=A0A4Q5IX12_9ACTN|nr:NAD(P)/FAD-dependent oxidoreductase [Nocardioides iriomotensis]RYU10660.1 NAD(P)/FAD-dependent oxidoreductase [Nocardioides iriomotensis]